MPNFVTAVNKNYQNPFIFDAVNSKAKEMF